MRSNRYSSNPALPPAVDGILVALSGWVAYFLRWNTWSMQTGYLLALLLGTVLTLLLLPLTGAYPSWRGQPRWQAIGHSIPGLAMVILALSLLGTMTKTTADYSRLWMAYWGTLSALSMFLFRGAMALLERWHRHHVAQPRQVLVIGDGELAATTANRLRDSPESNLAVCGFVATGDSGRPAELPAPVLGDLDSLETILAENQSSINEVWLAIRDFRAGQHELVVNILRSTALPVRFIPDLSMLPLLNHVPVEIAGMTVIDLNASPLQGYNALLKSVFDRLFSLTAILLLAPVFPLFALAIKLDSPGPVFFRQPRHGWDGQVIQVFKFRTMTREASASDSAVQATQEDARVTRVGRLLRKTSADELPQLFNVLRGDMSIVGPRPHPLALNISYIDQIDAFMQRHRVKPGITGWAQVHGLRGETDTLDKMRRRVEFDLYYIEHWSFWLDLKIILRTVTGGWKGDNAY